MRGARRVELSVAAEKAVEMLTRARGKEMHLCISPEERRVTISCGGGEEVVKVKGHHHSHQHRRLQFASRSILLAVLVLGVVFPLFLFCRALPPFLTLGGASIYRSIGCLRWRYGQPHMLGGSSSQ